MWSACLFELYRVSGLGLERRVHGLGLRELMSLSCAKKKMHVASTRFFKRVLQVFCACLFGGCEDLPVEIHTNRTFDAAPRT